MRTTVPGNGHGVPTSTPDRAADAAANPSTTRSPLPTRHTLSHGAYSTGVASFIQDFWADGQLNEEQALSVLIVWPPLHRAPSLPP